MKSGVLGKVISKIKTGYWQVQLKEGDELVFKSVKTSEIVKLTAKDKKKINNMTTTLADVQPNQLNLQEASLIPTVTSIITDQSTLTSEDHIINLEAPFAHSKMKQWIIFSDLHVKGSSIEVCEEVLQKVHETALAKEAGIIFLGDFWHVRGSLSVELLNRVLRSLRMWTQPVIMIPGMPNSLIQILQVSLVS
jgi:hypothetical protein